MKRLRANLSQGLNTFLSNHRVTLLLSYEEFDLINASLMPPYGWRIMYTKTLHDRPVPPGHLWATWIFPRSSDAVMFKLTWG